MPPTPLTPHQARWARIWMTLVLLGALLFLLGIDPDIVGLDRSPVVGFVQVGVWLTGLAILLISSYAAVRIVRNGRPLPLRAEIGERLIATGYVIAAAASLADFIGIGSHQIPELIFGPLQVIGLVVGILIALFGLVLYFPRQRRKAPKEEAPSPAKDSPAGMSPTTGAG